MFLSYNTLFLGFALFDSSNHSSLFELASWCVPSICPLATRAIATTSTSVIVFLPPSIVSFAIVAIDLDAQPDWIQRHSTWFFEMRVQYGISSHGIQSTRSTLYLS
jgi:hypothetical protein